MEDKKNIIESVKNWLLLGFIAICIAMMPYVISLNTAYIELRVKLATVEAGQLKIDDLNKLRDDIRKNINDAIKPIQDRLASDELRMNGLEVRK